MNIAKKPFLFNLSESNISLKDGFVSDDDKKIKHIKRITIREPVAVSVSFKIRKKDFILFLDYMENETKKGRLKFLIEINNEGDVFERVFDLLSTVSISFSSNIYSIEFSGVLTDLDLL